MKSPSDGGDRCQQPLHASDVRPAHAFGTNCPLFGRVSVGTSRIMLEIVNIDIKMHLNDTTLGFILIANRAKQQCGYRTSSSLAHKRCCQRPRHGSTA